VSPGEVEQLRAGARPDAEDPHVVPQVGQQRGNEQVKGVAQRGQLQPLLVVSRRALLVEDRFDFVAFHSPPEVPGPRTMLSSGPATPPRP
jgi:hypothetical protein